MYIAEKSKSGIQEVKAETYLTTQRVITLKGEINQETSLEVVQALLALDLKNHDEITLLIASGGGAINGGLAIYDAMNIIESPIRTVAVGTVASMAAVLFSSGTKGRRQMFPSSKIMIHDPRIIGSKGVMTTSEIIELGRDLQKTKDQTNGILAKNTGKDLSAINKDTLTDNWMSAEEAIAYGLADGIVERMQR